MRNEKNVKRFRQWREVKWGAAFEQNTFLHVQGPGLKPHLHRKLYMAMVELDKATTIPIKDSGTSAPSRSN